MGKLLETKLPISIGEVSSDTFNRLLIVWNLRQPCLNLIPKPLLND